MNVSFDHFGVLQIEPTDRCNLRCKMCNPHALAYETIHGIPKGLMELDRYRRIIDGLCDEEVRFDHIIFQWLGDPSLHPHLEEMVGYAASELSGRVGYLRIDTNAVQLNAARMERLVELYRRNPETPLLVVFTLDAVTPETYSVVKGADHLERVRRNIRHFIRRRAEIEGDDVRLNLQLQFVLQRENAHEVRQFVDYWRATLRCLGGGKGYNEIMVKRLSVGAGGEGQREADELYEREVKAQEVVAGPGDDGAAHVVLWESRPWESTDDEAPGGRQACPGLWMTPVIRHDGHLMMCCVDLQGELDLGQLGDGSSFLDLWQGELAERVRMAHIEGRFGDHPPCGDCGGINWYGTPLEFVEEWLGRRGRGALYEPYRARVQGS